MLQSQGQCLGNFQSISNVWKQNHVAMNSLNNVGMHNILQLESQSSSGIPPTLATQCALYNHADGAGAPQMYFAPPSSATPIQMSVANINTVPNTSNQYTYSAGPFIWYMGFLKDYAALTTITLTPTKTLIYGQATAVTKGSNAAGYQLIFTGSTFTVKNIPIGTKQNIYYFVVGV